MLLEGETAILPILLAALALDALIGDLPLLFRFVPHPISLLRRAIAWFDRRLNRETRSERARLERGVATAAMFLLGAVIVGWAAARFLAEGKLGWLVEMFLVTLLVTQRSVFDGAATVARGLDGEGAAGGRAALRSIGVEPRSLDDHGVARATVEWTAERFCNGVVGPAFWYALLGLPGLFAYKTVDTLAAMIGQKSPRYLAFGRAALRLKAIAEFAPTRLAGVIIALAALTDAGAAFQTMIGHTRKHRNARASWPQAAMAGALGLALRGPYRSGGVVVNEPWIGSGRARLTSADIRKALALFIVACAVHALLWLIVYAAGRM